MAEKSINHSKFYCRLAVLAVAKLPDNMIKIVNIIYLAQENIAQQESGFPYYKPQFPLEVYWFDLKLILLISVLVLI